MTRFAQWKKDLQFTAGIVGKRPFQVLLQLTNKCNMRCSFCDFWPNVAPRSEELSLEDYARVSDELAQLGTFLCSVEGGEPLVRPDLVEIIRTLSRHHITALFTNGWLVTDALARALFDAGLGSANVSIDYPQAARHDAKRGLEGATERAWRAVQTFVRNAPRGAKQVHVITVVTEDNWRDLPELFAQSAAQGVGHQLTLVSLDGYRRGAEGPDRLPPPESGEAMLRWHSEFAHIRMLRSYFEHVAPWLSGGASRDAMPTCAAGVQSFNIDHVGQVSACIEHIDRPVGSVKSASVTDLHAMLVAQAQGRSCQDCWTLCRGVAQGLGNGASARTLLEMSSRMRTT
ncbi:MAG: radical SAM protein [Deltaproteobacteria bacterium]|nr:radical SAM protein [Deltaproteobacteria bacterium]